jgi:WD40 repeat protein
MDSHHVGIDNRWEYRLIPGAAARQGTSNATVEIYDLSEHAAPRRLVTPVITATAVAVSRDGARLAVTGPDQSTIDAMHRYGSSLRYGRPPTNVASQHAIHILDATSGDTLRALSVPHRATNQLLFDRDGKRVLSVSTDRKMRVWDVSSGNLVRLIDGGGDQLVRPEYSPNGRWIVSGSATAGTINVWEVAKGEVTARFEGEPGQSVWAFHGNLLAVPVKGRRIKIWDLENGRYVLEMNDLGRKIEALAFLDSGKRLVSFSEGSLTLWTLETESEICSIPAPAYEKGQWSRIVQALEKLGRSAEE